jgi:hypothetical protein
MKNHFPVGPNALERHDAMAGDRALAAIADAFVVQRPPEAELIDVSKQFEFVFRGKWRRDRTRHGSDVTGDRVLDNQSASCAEHQRITYSRGVLISW